jgi:AcrR family transcriptional regulator
MGRRSDHSRKELEALILDAGQDMMAQSGLAAFSAREVAKRIGYSVGTVMNVFGSVDGLVMAINSRTFPLWTQWLEDRLAGKAGAERIQALVAGYFDFAASHRNLWSAIYQHGLPADMTIPEDQAQQRGGLMALVTQEIAAVLPEHRQGEAERLSRSLVAIVHGHCSFALGGSFALLGEEDPFDLVMQRVIEVLQAHEADPAG